MAGAGVDRARRVLLWVLGGLVVALVLSWLYAALWPRRERSVAGDDKPVKDAKPASRPKPAAVEEVLQ